MYQSTADILASRVNSTVPYITLYLQTLTVTVHRMNAQSGNHIS